MRPPICSIAAFDARACPAAQQGAHRGAPPDAGRRRLLAGAAALLGGGPPAARGGPSGRTLVVGPGERWRTLADAVRAAGDGDTLLLQPGEYRGDVAVVTQPRLAIRGLGPGAVFHADGRAAEGKAILVVRGGAVAVQNCEFHGTRVPSRNGAGIRFDAGVLAVRDCRFVDNEMGLLTSNEPLAALSVENSEFARNLRPDGHNHNLYAGSIARLSVRGCSLHHATTGHLLKSRAAVNHIHYNSLVDGPGGSASYELEFPNGGVAVVLGNVIAQGPASQNAIVVSFGAEGYHGSDHVLVLAHNTIVDKMAQGGRALRIAPGADVQVKAVNNLLAGAGAADFAAGQSGEFINNAFVDWAVFAAAAADDYRLAADAPPLRAIDPGSHDGRSLRPTHEFAAPRGTVELVAPADRVGAFQRSGQSHR